MAYVDWQSIISGQPSQKKRYSGANVRFFNAYSENEEKSIKEGRPIFDEIPSISIQWPGGDETVRRIEPQDMQEYPELYARFRAGSEPVTEGTPLAEWPMMNGSAMRELQYLGFKTVEQMANASEEAKRKLGPLAKFAKLAQEWLAAAKSDQNDVAKLRIMLEQEREKRLLLEQKLELMFQRVEANEGTDLRSYRKEVIPLTEAEDNFDDELKEEVEELPKRRGRPRRA